MGKLLAVLVGMTMLIGGAVALALITASDTAVAEDAPVATAATTEFGASVDDAAEVDDEAVEEVQVDRADRARPSRGDVLGGVLDDLVADGTITQDQADQIAATVAERATALREELRAQRGEGAADSRGLRFLGGAADLLDDGVIDADELASLGVDHPLNDPEGPAAQYLDDGQLTADELTELAAELRGNFGDGSRTAPGN